MTQKKGNNEKILSFILSSNIIMTLIASTCHTVTYSINIVDRETLNVNEERSTRLTEPPKEAVSIISIDDTRRHLEQHTKV